MEHLIKARYLLTTNSHMEDCGLKFLPENCTQIKTVEF